MRHEASRLLSVSPEAGALSWFSRRPPSYSRFDVHFAYPFFCGTPAPGEEHDNVLRVLLAMAGQRDELFL